MPAHTVRAMAFHSEKGYADQVRLAKAFAGEGGRIATVNDIVHARMHAAKNATAWTTTIITGSRVYAGHSKGRVPLLVFAHGNGPEPVPMCDLAYYRRSRFDSFRDSIKGIGIEPEQFEQLLSGHFGDVAIVDLNKYRNASVHKERHAGNRYNLEEALKDEIVRGFFGNRAEEFLRRYAELNLEWTDGKHATSANEDALVINRIYRLYNNHTGTYSVSGAVPQAYPLTIQSAGFYKDRETGTPHASVTEFGHKTDSGIDDLVFTPYVVVGVRGVEPITDIASDFRFVSEEVKEHWSIFAEPMERVPNDPFAGIPADGEQQPYYLLDKWGRKVGVTARIGEDGNAVYAPERRIINRRLIEAKTVAFSDSQGVYDQYPYPGLWDAALAERPSGTNAIAFGGACVGGGKCESDVAYYEVESEPFHFLMRCGEQLFSQYSTEKGPSRQPHRIVEESELIGQKHRCTVPSKVYELGQYAGDRSWPAYAYIAEHAPKGANAALLPDRWGGDGNGGVSIEVEYYRVTFGNRAFRPFAELRGDFDWQLDRRTEADILGFTF